MRVAMDTDRLRHAGLADSAVAAWGAGHQDATADYDADRQSYSQFWARCDDLVRRLPEKPARSSAEAEAAEAIFLAARDHRERFLAAHAVTVYDRLTQNRRRFMRLDDLLREAASEVPGLTPTAEQVAAESQRLQRDKDGIEIDQGIFLAHVLGSERAGRHLCPAML